MLQVPRSSGNWGLLGVVPIQKRPSSGGVSVQGLFPAPQCSPWGTAQALKWDPTLKNALRLLGLPGHAEGIIRISTSMHY